MFNFGPFRPSSGGWVCRSFVGFWQTKNLAELAVGSTVYLRDPGGRLFCPPIRYRYTSDSLLVALPFKMSLTRN